MSFARQIKFVPDVHKQNLPTHFLCIPLLDSASTPHYRASMRPLLNHPALASVPTTFFRPPGVLHLSLETISLAKPEQFSAATKLLESFNIVDILETAAMCHKNGVGFDSQRYWTQQSQQMQIYPKRRSHRRETIPLEVSLSGLWCYEGFEANINCLWTDVFDSTY